MRGDEDTPHDARGTYGALSSHSGLAKGEKGSASGRKSKMTFGPCQRGDSL